MRRTSSPTRDRKQSPKQWYWKAAWRFIRDHKGELPGWAAKRSDSNLNLARTCYVKRQAAS